MSEAGGIALTAAVARALVKLRDEGGEDISDPLTAAAAAVLMIQRIQGTQAGDPRDLGGAMVDTAGDPFAFHKVVLDARKALIVDYQEICRVDPESAQDQEDAFALMFQGRVNHTSDRAQIMLLGDLDFLAALVTEAHGVVERLGPEWPERFVERLEKRWEEMPHEP